MSFVIPVVFYEVTNVELCTRLTQLYLFVKYKVFSTQGTVTCFGA